MVKTRRGLLEKREEMVVPVKRSRNVQEQPQKDTDSDESGPIRSADTRASRGRELHFQQIVPSPKRRLRSGGYRLQPEQPSATHVTGRGKRGRQRIKCPDTREAPQNEKDSEPEIRRSHRRGRRVYDTLNVSLLTHNTFAHDWMDVDEQQKRRGQRRRQREASEDIVEGSELGRNMYDKIKSRHTPTNSPNKSKENVGSCNDDDEDDDDEEEDEDEENSDDDGDDDDDDDGEEEANRQSRRYLLRKKKPVTNRYMAPPMTTKRERKTSFRGISDFRSRHHKTPPHASPIRRKYRHRRKAMNMSSSTSSSSGNEGGMENDEQRFERRKSKSMAKARSRCLPMNFSLQDLTGGVLKDREKIGSSLADLDPMTIDHKVMFDSVGGLGKEIRSLKEMILFPLMYPEVFERFKVQPPRGVLFHGPPGTGKTLVARALANECSKGDKKVAFFMRKGADCLSKWVGESERQLRLLFDQAYSMRPSIIFFDEIDGLAPVRSSRQDQIHSSIVSTLLALMDGLDSRGEIVVIGATNRIDAIDPALRRPGRFDREFRFPLPDKNTRQHILKIHTKDWEPKLSHAFINEVADNCVGYCGADIKALCTEAALFALRRCYPQIYTSSKKLLLDVNSIEVTAKDFLKATKTIVPASQRAVVSPGRALSPFIKPLLQSALGKAAILLHKIFPPAQMKTVHGNSCNSLMGNTTTKQHQRCINGALLSEDGSSSDNDEGPSIFEPQAESARSARYMRRAQQRFDAPEVVETETTFFSFSENSLSTPGTYRPRILVCGCNGMGQSTHIAPALLHSMEHLTVHCLDLPALYGVTARTPEEACSQVFLEARRSAPCVLYMPHLNKLWNASGESVRATFLSLLQDLPPLAPVLLLATCNVVLADLPSVLQYIFSEETGQIIEMKMPTAVERRAFFKNLLLGLALQPPRPAKSRKEKTLEVLPFAPSPPPRLLSDRELKKIREDEDNTMRELRIFLRDVHSKLLSDRRFKEFSKPVDLEEVPDYLDVIREPMDLSTMMERIDSHCYGTCAQYLTDVELITSNALKYNPDVDPLDKIIRHRACELKDLAHSLVYSQLEPEFEKACEEILASRARRGEQPCPVAPAYIFTNINNRKRITRTPAEPSTGAEQTHDNDEREPGAAVVNFVDDNKTAVSQHARNSPKNKSKSKTKRFGYRRRHKKGNWKRKLEGDLNRSKGDNSGNLNEMDDDTEEMSDKEDSKHEEVDDDFSNKMEDESVDKMNNVTDEKEELNLTLQLSVDQKAVGSAEEKKLVFPESSNNCINKNILTNGINSHDLTEYMEQGDPIIEKEEHVSVSESEVCNYDSGDIAVLSDIETPSKVNSTRKDEERECNKMYQNAHHEKTIHPNGICLPQAISRMHKVQGTEPVQKGMGSPLSIDIKDCSETLGSGVGDDTEKISELKNNCSAVRQERGKTNPGVDEDCRQQMENLLSRVVDVTIDLPVETLERYHCILHHCVHEHRRDTDKTSLIQKLEQLIESFVESKSEKR